MQKIKWKNSAALLLAAFVWGVAFVAQSVGMDYVEPFTFNGIRCLIGSLVLLPCIFFFDRFKTSEEKEAVKSSRKTLWICGNECTADRNTVYFCRKSRFYYGIVHCVCADHWNIFKEKMQLECLGQCSDRSYRILSFMCQRWPESVKR